MLIMNKSKRRGRIKPLTIAVVATLAEDRFTHHGRTETRKGGPAFYISDTLRRLRVPYRRYTPKFSALISIVMLRGEERGVITKKPPRFSPRVKPAGATIVSTILDEVPLHAVADFPGFVAVDLQGYIRASRARGVKHLMPPDAIHFDLVKLTEEEARYVDPRFLELQKQRILVMTHGPRGAEIWSHGKRMFISVKKLRVRHALGAGDRYLAAFVASFLRNQDAALAGRFAAHHIATILTKPDHRPHAI